MQCSRCKKLFARLDTHLRRSAACRSISLLPSPDAAVHRDVQSTEAAIFLTPLNLNSATPAQAVSCETTNILPVSSTPPTVKGHLLLPKTAEGWEAANEHFNTILVPAVLTASSLSEKYSTLIDGIYSYFQSACGSRAVRLSHQHQKKKRPLHNTSLKRSQSKRRRLSLSCGMHTSRGSPLKPFIP